MFWNGLNKKNKNEQSQYFGGFCFDQRAAVSTVIRLSWVLLQFRQDSETLSFTLSFILIGQRIQKEPICRLVIGRELVKSSKFSTPTTP